MLNVTMYTRWKAKLAQQRQEREKRDLWKRAGLSAGDYVEYVFIQYPRIYAVGRVVDVTATGREIEVRIEPVSIAGLCRWRLARDLIRVNKTERAS